jgi:hypothetical protein
VNVPEELKVIFLIKKGNHNWIEQITYQMCKNNNNLAGTIALLKVQVTKDNEFVAREASQILGGNSYLRYFIFNFNL